MRDEDFKYLDADDQLFLFLQSIGIAPRIPLWEYQKKKRELEQRLQEKQADGGYNEKRTA